MAPASVNLDMKPGGVSNITRNPLSLYGQEWGKHPRYLVVRPRCRGRIQPVNVMAEIGLRECLV